jgi:hypothetical protein
VPKFYCVMCLADGDKTEAAFKVDEKAYCRRCAQSLIRAGGHGPAIPIDSDLHIETRGRQKRLTTAGRKIALTQTEVPVATLAVDLGVSTGAIYAARKRNGLPPSTAPTSDTVRAAERGKEAPPRATVVGMEDVPRVRPRKQSFLLPFWEQLKALEPGQVLKLEFGTTHRANYTRNKLGKWAQAEGWVLRGHAVLTTRYLWLEKQPQLQEPTTAQCRCFDDEEHYCAVHKAYKAGFGPEADL